MLFLVGAQGVLLLHHMTSRKVIPLFLTCRRHPDLCRVRHLTLGVMHQLQHHRAGLPELWFRLLQPFLLLVAICLLPLD